MMSDEKVREMAELLSSGATMLSEACPKCGSPLFKLRDGKVVCVSCDHPTEERIAGEPATTSPPVDKAALKASLRDILNEKLPPLIAALKEARDPDEIRTILSCISEILEFLGEE